MIKFILILSISVSICSMSVIKKYRNVKDDLVCSYGFVFNGTDCEECGLRDVDSNIKIVGGIEAAPYSWPSQVLIIRTIEGDYNILNSDGSTTKRKISEQFLCGGTLINSFTILTAAHCTSETFTYSINGKDIDLKIQTNAKYPTFESMFSVFLGVHNKNFIDYGGPLPKNVVKTIVSKIIRHSEFNSNSLLNDIALLQLSKPIKSNAFMKPACLPSRRSFTYPGVNKDVFAVGWGSLYEGGWSPSNLYNVKIKTYDSSSCSAVANSMPKNWNSQICAGNIAGGQDTCQGDSGGGLYSRSIIANKERNEVIGVVSYGTGCARARLPGIYTRVSFHLDWIRANMKSAK